MKSFIDYLNMRIIKMVAKLTKYKNKEWAIYLIQSGTYLFAPKNQGLSSYQKKKQLKQRIDQLNKLKG